MNIFEENTQTGLSCGINDDGKLFLGDDKSGYNLPDTPENTERILEEFYSHNIKEINAKLEIVKLDNEPFEVKGKQVACNGYAFKHPKGYISFKGDDQEPYIPRGGEKALQEILDAGGFLNFKGMQFIQSMRENEKFVKEQKEEVIMENHRYLENGDVVIGNNQDSTIKEYQKQVAAIQGKFPNQRFGEFQDGQIAIEMLKNGFDRDEVKAVIGEYTPNKGKFHPVYEEAVVKKSLESIQAIETIKGIKDKIQREEDIMNYEAYMKYAREHRDNAVTIKYQMYMSECLEGKTVDRLNGHDEQKVIARMIGDGITKEDIIKSIKEASPIIKEPGRDADKYVSKVVELGTQEYEKGLYRDGQIAVGMLNGGFDKRDVVKAVELESLIALKIKDNGKEPYKYASYIVLEAQKVVERLNHINKDENFFTQTQEQAEAILDYRERFKKEVGNECSFNSSIDISIAVGMINSNRFSRKEIVFTVNEVSPMAILPGHINNYAEYVFEKAETQIATLAEKVMETQIKTLYKEGKNNNEVSSEMLLKKYSKHDIINALMKHAPNMPDRSDEARKAAHRIVRSAEREIANHERNVRSAGMSR